MKPSRVEDLQFGASGPVGTGLDVAQDCGLAV